MDALSVFTPHHGSVVGVTAVATTATANEEAADPGALLLVTVRSEGVFALEKESSRSVFGFSVAPSVNLSHPCHFIPAEHLFIAVLNSRKLVFFDRNEKSSLEQLPGFELPDVLQSILPIEGTSDVLLLFQTRPASIFSVSKRSSSPLVPIDSLLSPLPNRVHLTLVAESNRLFALQLAADGLLVVTPLRRCARPQQEAKERSVRIRLFSSSADRVLAACFQAESLSICLVTEAGEVASFHCGPLVALSLHSKPQLQFREQFPALVPASSAAATARLVVHKDFWMLALGSTVTLFDTTFKVVHGVYSVPVLPADGSAQSSRDGLVDLWALQAGSSAASGANHFSLIVCLSSGVSRLDLRLPANVTLMSVLCKAKPATGSSSSSSIMSNPRVDASHASLDDVFTEGLHPASVKEKLLALAAGNDAALLTVLTRRAVEWRSWVVLDALIDLRLCSFRNHPELLDAIADDWRFESLVLYCQRVRDMTEDDIVRSVRLVLSDMPKKSHTARFSGRVLDAVLSVPFSPVAMSAASCAGSFSPEELRALLARLTTSFASISLNSLASSDEDTAGRRKGRRRHHPASSSFSSSSSPSFSSCSGSSSSSSLLSLGQTVEWLNVLCDAHFTTLALSPLDVGGLSDLLRTLQRFSSQQLQLCNYLEPLQGVMQHLKQSAAIPGQAAQQQQQLGSESSEYTAEYLML